ncbi:MAG: diguanylate cyclase [Pseudomonadota bacterium]
MTTPAPSALAMTAPPEGVEFYLPLPLPEEVVETNRTVLIIDDAAANREALAELLGGDYMVIQAAGGAEGLEKARCYLPDLILLDVLMPGMGGYDVLRQLQADARTAGIAVIFITGLDRPEDEARGLRLGGCDYIPKPLNPPVVQARVALHLRAARDRRRLEALASVDSLTGIANRRQFDAVLAAECRRALRTGQPVAVAMVDVDYFKRYNDSYGHAQGDRALRAVADVLRSGMRRTGDLAARYGGEEFALVMVDTHDEHAADLMASVCAAVRALAIPHRASSAAPCLTISIGVASSAEDGMLDPAALLQRADDRLYRAKATGRGRVVASGGYERAARTVKSRTGA